MAVNDNILIDLASLKEQNRSLTEQQRTHSEEISILRKGVNDMTTTCATMGNEMKNVASVIKELNDNVRVFAGKWFDEKNNISNKLHDIEVHNTKQEGALAAIQSSLNLTSIKARYALLLASSLAVAFIVTILVANVFGAEAAGQFAAGVNQATKH